MTYQPYYNEPFILPPKVSPELPSRGSFTLIFFTPKFITQTPHKQHIRYKLWGEDQHRTSNFSTPTIFQIKCSNANFANYLRDMKFLKTEIVDARNSTVIGSAVINLMLYINSEPMLNETDCPFIPMKECFDVLKNNIMKSKIGEIEIQIGCQFYLKPRQISNRGNLLEDRKQTSLNRFSSDPKIEIPMGLRSISFKKDIGTINQIQQSHQNINNATNNQIESPSINQTSKNLPSIFPYKPKAVKKSFVFEPFLPNNNPVLQTPFVNVEAEVAKLRLDAFQLLQTSAQTQSSPQQLKIIISKATVNLQQSYFTVEYPIKIGYSKTKVISAQILPISSSRNQIKYNKVITLSNLKQISQHSLKFTFRNNKKQIVGVCECDIYTLNQKQQLRLSINHKGKEIGKLFIDPFFQSKNQQPQKQLPAFNPLTNPALNKDSSPKNIPKQNLTPDLMIIISISKAHLLNQQGYDCLYFKTSFKLQKQSYQTNMSKTKRWNFVLTTSINSSVPIETPFLMFELWGSGTATSLLGIGKYRTKELFDIVTSGVMNANLEPVLLYDSNLPIEGIVDKDNIGYLTLRIKVGTPKQISKALESLTQIPPKQSSSKQQSDQYPSHSSSTPQLATDRQATSSKTQQKNVHSPQVPNSSRPSELNQQPTNNQVLQIHNLMQTVTGFFSAISDSKQKIELILKQMNLSGDMKMDEFDKVISKVLDNYQQYWDVVSFFYGEGDHINTLEFLKSFSSFVNFKQILIQQLTALLQQLNDELSKVSLSLDIVQNKLTQYSQFGFISNQNIREVFRGYKIDSFLIDRILQTYASTKQNQLQVSQFIHHLKCSKFHKNIESLNYNLTNLQHLIQNSVIDVITLQSQNITIITETYNNKNMDSKTICQLLQTLEVDVSIWESLLLIESIKIFFKQDLDLVEGIISSKVMINWLKSVVNINQIPRVESVGQRTEPDVVVLRTMRTETNGDDIQNIADLLKEKDKLEYQDSSLPKKHVGDNHSQYPSKLLEESKQSYNPREEHKKHNVQSNSKNIPSYYSSPSIPNKTQSQNPSSIHTPRIKYLKIKTIQTKLDIDFNYLTLQLQLIRSYQILIKKQQGALKYYSPSTFNQQIDINNISQYKKHIQGLNLTCRSMSYGSQQQTVSKGFISFQDTFKVQATVNKKICILYNNQMKIIGRVVLEISFIDKQQQSEVIHKQFLFLRVVKIDSNLQQKSRISFSLSGSTKIEHVELMNQYQIQLDNKIYKGIGEFSITTSTNAKLSSEFSIQNLFTSKMVKLDLPLLKQNNQYYGLMSVQLVIKQQQQITTTLNVPSNNYSFTGIIYIDSLISTTEKSRNLNVSFSVNNGFSVSSSVFQQLYLQQPLIKIPINQIHYIQSLKSEQEIEITMQDANSKLEIGKAKFKVNHSINRQFNYLGEESVILINKFNIAMVLNMRMLVIDTVEGVKLGNVLEKLRRDRLERIRMNLDALNTGAIRGALRMERITLSEIQYFIQILNQDKSGEERQKILKDVFDQDASVRSKEEAVALLRQFQFYDPNKTGRILNSKLKAIIQGYEIQQIKTQGDLLDINSATELISYLPYLSHKIVENQINQLPLPIPIPINNSLNQQQIEYPKHHLNQQQNEITQNTQFKRICGQINKLHSILTKAKQS